MSKMEQIEDTCKKGGYRHHKLKAFMSTVCLQLVPSAYTRTGRELSASTEEDGDPGTGCGAFSGTVSSAVADTTGTSAGLEGAIAVVTFPCLRALTMPPRRVRIRCNLGYCPC